jgi:hypothetical protein
MTLAPAVSFGRNMFMKFTTGGNSPKNFFCVIDATADKAGVFSHCQTLLVKYNI